MNAFFVRQRDPGKCFRPAAWRVVWTCAFLWMGRAVAAEQVFDRLDDALTVSAAGGEVRGRLSGTLDLEGYGFTQPAPGLIGSPGSFLFSPRLTTFLDVQVGGRVYAFAQMRVDRNFDPGRRHVRGRLDEYALRFTPWADGRFNVQVGKFGTIVGNWVPRHGAWENPFVTAPLAYEQLTGVWDGVAADSLPTLLDWAHIEPRPPRGAPATDKHLRLPLFWGPSYATGALVSGEAGQLNFALEAKDAGLASRPKTWDRDNFQWRHPTVSARLGYRPSPRWHFGVSGSSGTYLSTSARSTIPPGRSLGDYRQTVLGHDIGFAWHHVQIWAEVFGSRFSIPGVGDADALSYYVEAKYKLTPRVSAAVRWNELHFGKLPDGAGGRVRWGANTKRIDFGPAYRFTPHIQLKLQYSLQFEEGAPRETGQVGAVQLTVRF